MSEQIQGMNETACTTRLRSTLKMMPTISLDHIFMLCGLIMVACGAGFFIHSYLTLQLDNAFWTLEALFIIMLICLIVTQRVSALSITFLVIFWIFTLSRPTIQILVKGWHPFTDIDQAQFQLMILFACLISFFIATIVAAYLLNPKPIEIEQAQTRTVQSSLSNRQVQRVALIFFLICYAFMMYISIEKLMFMQGRTYVEYFRDFVETAPLPVRTMATFCPYALCMYLATFPRKKPVYIVLILYTAANIPMLMFGLRGRFAFSLVFCLIYFLLRDRMGDDEKWIGRVEKTLIIIGIPVLMLLFDALNYARSGVFSAETSIFMKIIDFIHKQGVTYSVLGYAYNGFPGMANYSGEHIYTFGPFIDYIGDGPFARILFDKPYIPETNSVIMATMSNSFSHLLSFVTHPNYLGGEGYGSSYMLEVYYDFSWKGVVIFNAVMGALLVYLPRLMKNNRIVFFISLIALTNFYWLIRDSAFGWAMFLVTPQFWLSVLIMAGGLVAYRHLSRPIHGIRLLGAGAACKQADKTRANQRV